MPNPETEELPPVGSMWRAKDGRVMHVIKWFERDYFGNRAAKMEVVNPGKGVRRTTQADLRRFGSFLTPWQDALNGE